MEAPTVALAADYREEPFSKSHSPSHGVKMQHRQRTTGGGARGREAG